MKKCIICENPLQGQQTKYCSTNCKVKGHYRRVKEQTNTTYSQFKRGYVRKLVLIELHGGCCTECGYNKNAAGLQFHHTRDKKFPLDSRNLSNRKMSDILAEAEKCILLCGTCHAEHHHPELEVVILLEKYQEDVDRYLQDLKK